MKLKKSLTYHLQAGNGILGAKWFGKRDVVGYYSGSLVYENMTWHQHTTKKYEEAVMQVTRESFCKWAKGFADTVKDREGKEHAVGIVPAPFCAMKYIDDGRYQPGDAVLELEQEEQGRTKKVESYQAQSSDMHRT